jgi:hypothetical protein
MEALPPSGEPRQSTHSSASLRLALTPQVQPRYRVGSLPVLKSGSQNCDKLCQIRAATPAR